MVVVVVGVVVVAVIADVLKTHVNINGRTNDLWVWVKMALMQTERLIPNQVD